MVLYAKDILETDFLLMPQGTNALEAARVMRDRHHGYVIVGPPGGMPEGIVTEWDFLSKVVAEARDAASLTLKDLMTSNIVTVKADEGIETVSELMAHRGIRRVLVMKDGRVLGVIQAKTILSKLKTYVDRVSAQIARTQTPMF